MNIRASFDQCIDANPEVSGKQVKKKHALCHGYTWQGGGEGARLDEELARKQKTLIRHTSDRQNRFLVDDLDLSGQIRRFLICMIVAHFARVGVYNLHDIAHVSRGGSELYRSCTACHNGS